MAIQNIRNIKHYISSKSKLTTELNRIKDLIAGMVFQNKFTTQLLTKKLKHQHTPNTARKSVGFFTSPEDSPKTRYAACYVYAFNSLNVDNTPFLRCATLKISVYTK